MDFELDDRLRAEIYAHAAEVQPRECCGLIARTAWGDVIYERIPNISADGSQFLMDPGWYAAAEDAHEAVLAIVHSHPNASANPSMADRVGCEKSGVPWIICGWPSGVFKQLEPSGWQAPYTRREFHHGVLDCYTLIQDWYLRELQLELPDFDREDGWWEKRADHAPQDLYMQNFAAAGFVQVFGEPQRHDGILMQVASDRANHGAVYLGNGVMLHHLHGRLSEETVYGGYWARHTVALVRHISRISPMEASAIALASLQERAAA
ncbi:MAG: C40 family peptidase [Burkholderiaceae bacterium]